MADTGYIGWDRNFLQNPPGAQRLFPRIGTYTMQGSIGEYNFQQIAEGTDILTLAGTHISQFVWRGGDMPVTIQQIPTRLRFLTVFEEDYFQWLEAVGPPVLFFPSVSLSDVWLIEAADATQTLWRSSRRTGWDDVTITHTTHPPKAFIDAVEQTVITTGTPIAGEVLVPETQAADQGYFSIETPAGISGLRLKLRYPPEFLIRVLDARPVVGNTNEMIFSVRIVDLLSGVYSV